MVEKKGRETASLLPSLISEVIAKFPWQKSMRWGMAKRDGLDHYSV